MGLDPRDATGNNGQQGDPEGDGVANLQENSNNADPRKADTGGDGANDRVEIKQASDPSNAADEGQTPPPGTTAALQIRQTI